jgi:hypothetical protein
MKTYDLRISEDQRALLEMAIYNLSVAMDRGEVRLSTAHTGLVARLNNQLEAENLEASGTNYLIE